jgi:hypothetical protein
MSCLPVGAELRMLLIFGIDGDISSYLAEKE